MATKRNIDINKVRPGGSKITNGIFIGSRECNYVVRGTGGGSVVEYDKVTYELTLSDHINIEPDGGTWSSTTRVATNKRTHGNNVVDTGLALSPATYTIAANTGSTAKEGTITLTQYSGSEEFPNYGGASETFTWKQLGDYPVSITISFTTAPAIIPASGGSVTSTNYKTSTTFKSGRVAEGLGTVTWTGVTAASKTTTISNQTNAGTLKADVTYTLNGKTVTATTSTTVYQAENKVTGLTATCGTFAYTRFTAAGGTAVPSTNNANGYVFSYSSKATGTTIPTTTYGTFTTGLTYSLITGNGFSLASSADGSVKADSRGTTIGAIRNSNTITKAYSVKWTPNSTYAGSTLNASDSQTATASQEANAITGTTYTDPTVTLSIATAFAVTGETKTPTGVSYSQTKTDTYTSTATATTTISTGGVITYSMTNANGFTLNNSSTGQVTASNNDSTSARSNNTYKVTVTLNGKTGSASATLTQVAGAKVYSNVSAPVMTYAEAPATGGTVNVTISTPATQTYTWNGVGTSYDVTGISYSYAKVTGDGMTVNATNGAVTWTANTTTTAKTGSVKATVTGEGGKTNNVTVSTSQAAASASVSVSPTSWNPTSAATSTALTITCNTSWTISGPSWISYSSTSGSGDKTITATTTSNTGVERTGTITVTANGGGTATCSVTQKAGQSLSITPVSWNPVSAATSTTLTITCNGAWTATSTATSWLTVGTGTGSGNANITISVSKNSDTTSRTGKISVTNGHTTVECTVTQAEYAPGAVVYGNVTAPTISYATASSAASSKASVAITAATQQWWYEDTPGTKYSYTSFTYTYSVAGTAASINSSTGELTWTANTGTTERSVTVTVTAHGGGGKTATATATAKQSGASADLTISPTLWNPTSGGGNQVISITANTSWTASTDAAWITFTSSSTGSGNGSINLSAAANTGATERTATVTVKTATLTKTCTITQAKAAVVNVLNVDLSKISIATGKTAIVFSVDSLELEHPVYDGAIIFRFRATITDDSGTNTKEFSGPSIISGYKKINFTTQINSLGTNITKIEFDETYVTTTPTTDGYYVYTERNYSGTPAPTGKKFYAKIDSSGQAGDSLGIVVNGIGATINYGQTQSFFTDADGNVTSWSITVMGPRISSISGVKFLGKTGTRISDSNTWQWTGTVEVAEDSTQSITLSL